MLRLHHYSKLEAIENKHHESTTMGELSVEAPSVSAVIRSITEEAAMWCAARANVMSIGSLR